MFRSLVAALAVVVATLLAPLTATPAHADGPGSGTPWVVSVGDSYISGEAGRWAGARTLAAPGRRARRVRVLRQRRRHRRDDRALPPQQERRGYIGGGVSGLNLACSGAKTATSDRRRLQARPRLLRRRRRPPRPGARCCSVRRDPQREAGGRRRSAATTSTSPAIVQQCVTDFLTSPSWCPDYCKDDSVGRSRTSPRANVTAVRGRIATAFQQHPYRDAQRRLRRQRVDAARADLPVADPARQPGFRYGQSGYTRQSIGGCGFWNARRRLGQQHRAATINNTVRGAISQSGLTNAQVARTAVGVQRPAAVRERPSGCTRRSGLASWTQRRRGRPDRVDQPDPHGVDRSAPALLHPGVPPPELLGPARHPLVRAAGLQRRYAAGGTCTISGTGLLNGEPRMTLQ